MASLPRAEIVMIGSELLLGQIVDSNAARIGTVLAENGIHLYRKTTIGDNRARIVQVLAEALDRADVVLTSGGLGPTEDDLTREAVAEVFGVDLEFHQEIVDEIVERFKWMGRTPTENNKKQAYIPNGGAIVPNPHGTAPGFRCGDERGEIICMPGVPHELEAMLADRVLPHLRDRFGIPGVLHSRVLKVCGVGESRVDDAIGDLIRDQANPTVGVLASPNWVRIRITAKADSVEAAEALIEPVDAQVRERLPGLVMGVDDDTLEGVVDGLFRERGWSLAVGETITGGMIAQRLTAEGADCLAGAEVLPPNHVGEGDHHEAAYTWAGELRTRYGTDAALAVAANVRERRACITLITPCDKRNWEVGFAAVDTLSQTRTSVAALERVRRHLAGPA